MKTGFLHLLVLFVVPSLVIFVACADDPSPRPPGGTGPSPTGHSTTPGEDAGAGDDISDEDATTDVEDDDQICDIELPLPGDERYPCCFSDADCASSTSPFADELRCYHAECTDGGWGTCRRPPQSPATNECWDDDDCPDDQACAFDPDLDVDCTEPGTQEVWDICI